MMYILYGGRYTRAQVVEMVMLEGDIDYELREVDIIKREHLTEAYLAINPAGWVPALVTAGGDVLYETAAINLFLAETHHLSHLVPRLDESDRGLFLSGLFYLHDELEPIMKRYFYPHRYVVRESDTPRMKEMALTAALERFAVIDRRLGEEGPYHLGERFSLVDLVMAYWSASISYLGVLEPYAGVTRCTELVQTRPAISHKFAEQAAWGEEYRQMQARGEGVQ